MHSAPSCAGHCRTPPLLPRPTQNTEGIGTTDCSDDSHEQRKGARLTATGVQDSTKGYGFQLMDPTKRPALKLIQHITCKPTQPAHVPRQHFTHRPHSGSWRHGFPHRWRGDLCRSAHPETCTRENDRSVQHSAWL